MHLRLAVATNLLRQDPVNQLLDFLVAQPRLRPHHESLAPVAGTPAADDVGQLIPTLAYRVLASWKEGNDYCVGLEFMNTTLHGGYVERIDVKKPTANFDFKVAKAKRVGKGFGLDEKRSRRPPTRPSGR